MADLQFPIIDNTNDIKLISLLCRYGIKNKIYVYISKI